MSLQLQEVVYAVCVVDLENVFVYLVGPAEAGDPSMHVKVKGCEMV